MNLFKRIIHWLNTAPLSEIFVYTLLASYLITVINWALFSSLK